jgi:serine/threonine protein phosphatase PrpC
MHVPRRGGGESKARKPPSAGSVRTLFKSVPEEDEEQEVLSGEEKCARRHSIADEMDDGIDISRSTTNPDSPLAMASPDYHLAKRYSISSPATRRASINSISSSTRRGAWERVTMPAPFVKQRAMSDLWQEMGSYRTNGYSMQNLADSIENIRRENAHRQYARISRVSHHTVVGYKHKVKDQPSEDRYAIHDSLTPDPLPFLSDCDDDEDDDAGPLGTFSMFAVFDGHGGGNCADFLSKSCGHVLASEPVLWDEDLVAFERLAVATTSTFLTLENRHCEWAQDSEDLSGSTAIMGSYADGVLVMAAIGDSQGVFVDHKKQLRTLCPAHTVDNPKEVERVISQGGFIKNGRVGGIMMPTRAIGGATGCIPSL